MGFSSGDGMCIIGFVGFVVGFLTRLALVVLDFRVRCGLHGSLYLLPFGAFCDGFSML